MGPEVVDGAAAIPATTVRSVAMSTLAESQTRAQGIGPAAV